MKENPPKNATNWIASARIDFAAMDAWAKQFQEKPGKDAANRLNEYVRNLRRTLRTLEGALDEVVEAEPESSVGERLARLGYGHRKSKTPGKEEVYCLQTGDVVGVWDAPEVCAFNDRIEARENEEKITSRLVYSYEPAGSDNLVEVESDVWSKSEVGREYFAWAGALGQGRVIYRITRKDDTGLYGVVVDNAIRSGDL
jgi:hypothetical protein